MTRPRSQILYIYGGFVRRLGGWLPVATLLDLMADLGVEPPTVRAAVTRMTQVGLLESRRREAVAGYALTPKSWQILEEGDRRMLSAREPATLADGWVLVIFSVPETERHKRHQLRSQLTWLGFGTIAPGAWIAPARLRPELESVLERAGLLAYTERFDVVPADVDGSRRLTRKAWDLESLAGMYRAFTARWAPVLERWQRDDQSTRPETGFREYIALVADWRRLPYLDPGLPAEVLPNEWEGDRARTTYFALLAQLDGIALEYVTCRCAERLDRTSGMQQP